MRPLVKSAIHKCILCQRHKPRLAQQLMGDLPAVRVTPARPFTITGLHYAGPFRVRTSKGRGQSSYKGYIALFVCFITKAIHLELVSDLTTATFIAAFRRFVSRRGLCSQLYCDNATTYRGADTELRAMLKSASDFYKDVSKVLANDGLSEDIGYVLYSALGSFYIPSCIMVFVYIRIYYAAKARARRGIKPPRPRPAAAQLPSAESPNIRQTSFTQTSNLSIAMPGSGAADQARGSPCSAMENVATIENQPVQIPIVTCDFASDVSTSEADPGGGNIPMEEKDTLKVSAPLPTQKSNLKATLSVNGEGQSAQGIPARCRAPSVGIDVDMVSELDPSSSDSGVVSRCAVVKPLKLRFCKPIFGRKAMEKLKQQHQHHHHHDQDDRHRDMVEESKVQKPRDPEREKRRIARKKEKRATLILGLIMGSFIACWLPFFFLYIVKPLFPNLAIPEQAFAIAFWLGYMNSALNPVIYTVFNKDFRRAFRRILFK